MDFIISEHIHVKRYFRSWTSDITNQNKVLFTNLRTAWVNGLNTKKSFCKHFFILFYFYSLNHGKIERIDRNETMIEAGKQKTREI